MVTFETVPLAPSGYFNGSDGSGGIALEGVTFSNNYNTTLPAPGPDSPISNHTDTTTTGYLNQYSAYTGGGAGGSANYAVGYYSTYETATTNVTFGALTDLAGLGALFTNYHLRRARHAQRRRFRLQEIRRRFRQ